MAKKNACPDCGAPLMVTEAEAESVVFRQPPGRVPYVDAARRPTTVACCTGCEFVIEVKER